MFGLFLNLFFTTSTLRDKKIVSVYATIRTRREIQCLLYAGFLKYRKIHRLCLKGGTTNRYSNINKSRKGIKTEQFLRIFV